MQADDEGPRALVVDDNVAIVTSCARALTAHGYRVETAPDAESALRAVRGTSFDVIVSDIQMPGMSGLELVAQLRADGLDTPIVLITGDPQLETAMKAVEHGVLRYLTKPVAPSQLVVVVNAVVRIHGIARAERAALDNAGLRSLVEELRRSKDAALAGVRAKTEFLSKMGHELRTPMSIVMGMTELALETELTPLQREYLQTARAAAESLMKIIAHVLDLSALESGRLEVEAKPFSVRDAVDGVLKRLLPFAEAKGLSLTSNTGSDIPDALVGDPLRFRQIVDNLLNNAVKFTATGAVRINVSLEAHGRDDEVRVCVSISDTGIGITPEALVHVSEAFLQGDNSSTRRYGGAGLGLTIASQLVTLMNGSLKIESTHGVGTTVRFALSLGRVPELDTFFLVDAHAAHRTV